MQAMRQSELWLKYCFTCCCTRCSVSPPSYVDCVLQEISASNMESLSLVSDHSLYRDEATVKLTDYIDEVIMEYLSTGHPEFCCNKLESMLIYGLLDQQLETNEGKLHLNFRLHPLHHLALNAYTTLASAYKVRANNLLALYSEVDACHLEGFDMLRTSTAYSLLLAVVTHHLFLFESSFIASVANFWGGAGESLLTLARSSAWSLFGKCSLRASDLSSFAKERCFKCSLLDKYEANFFSNHGQQADFESLSTEFCDCISRFLQQLCSFLFQGCRFFKIFNNLDFSLLGKSSNLWGFDTHTVNDQVDPNCSTMDTVSALEAQGHTNELRMTVLQLGVHCLLYGGILDSICYGQQSQWACHINTIIHSEGI